MTESFTLTDEQRAEALRHVAPVEPTSSWAAIDLAPALRGEGRDPEPTLLARTDGPCLIYEGKAHQISGEPEACKGWLALHAVAGCLARGSAVVYYDFEDDEHRMAERLVALGCEPVAVTTQFFYVRPHEPLGAADTTEIDGLMDLAPELVVIDGVTEALTIHGLDLGSNADIAKWLDLLPRRITRSGAAVLLVDHVVKDKESRGRYALGAQHKLAGIDVAYGLEVVEPFGRGKEGTVRLTVMKDRGGHVRQHAQDDRIADMRLRSNAEDNTVAIELTPPGEEKAFRPTVLMERISEAIAGDPGMSARDIREGVSGKSEAKQKALALLVAEGYVERRQEGQAKRHYPVRPYVDADDRAPVPQPCPNRAPAPSNTTVPRAPTPLGGTVRGAKLEGLPGGEQPRPAPPDMATANVRVLDEDELATRLVRDFGAMVVEGPAIDTPRRGSPTTLRKHELWGVPANPSIGVLRIVEVPPRGDVLARRERLPTTNTRNFEGQPGTAANGSTVHVARALFGTYLHPVN